MTVAMSNGGEDHFGWGLDRHMIADLYDAINQNTRATGNWGKGKAPTFPMFPRPKSKPKKAVKKATTVASLFQRFGQPRRS